MIKHTLKIIWEQRAANAWIWAEIGLVAIFLWYIADTLYVHLHTYLSPLGFNIEHTYDLRMDALSDGSSEYIPESERTTSTAEDLYTILDRIRACPGVEAVCLSTAAYPYNGSNSYTSLKRDTLDFSGVHRRHVTPEFFRVFKFTASNGETEPLVENLTFNQLVISQDLADRMYPEGEATGKEIGYNADDSIRKRVGAVSTAIRFDDFRPVTQTFFHIMDKDWLVSNLNEQILPYLDICIRVSPEADKDFPATFRRLMGNRLRYNNLYLLDIQSFESIRERHLSYRMDDFKMYLAITVFLLANIFFGVAGTFWFRTQSRRNEMGLRMAMGSTGGQLRYLLMGEGLLLLVMAFLPAMAVSLNVGLSELVDTELMPFTLVRFFFGQLATFVLLASMIIAGISFPARKATQLKPVEALRYE